MEAPLSRIVVIEHLSLDGVYQAPARTDEDPSNGFGHGGWAAAGDHPEMQKAIGARMDGGWSLLVGRTTYEALHEGWVVRQPASPMTKALTAVEKFVVSRDPNYRLTWSNSTLLAGEATETVGALKLRHGKPLIVFGSGLLVGALMRRRLVDEMLLMSHPLILGEGKRFFEGAFSKSSWKLLDATSVETGVVIASYAAA